MANFEKEILRNFHRLFFGDRNNFGNLDFFSNKSIWKISDPKTVRGRCCPSQRSKIISVLCYRLSHVTSTFKVLFTNFSTFAWGPQRQQAVLGTQIFLKQLDELYKMYCIYFFWIILFLEKKIKITEFISTSLLTFYIGNSA